MCDKTIRWHCHCGPVACNDTRTVILCLLFYPQRLRPDHSLPACCCWINFPPYHFLCSESCSQASKWPFILILLTYYWFIQIKIYGYNPPTKLHLACQISALGILWYLSNLDENTALSPTYLHIQLVHLLWREPQLVAKKLRRWQL